MKKIIFLCTIAFTWIAASAGTVKPVLGQGTRANLIEELSKDKDFTRFATLTYNLAEMVRTTKSMELIIKYHKKTITAEEKKKLFEQLKLSGEAQLTGIYKNIFESRNNVVKTFPELQQKSQSELIGIVTDATKNRIGSSAEKITGNARVVEPCWQVLAGLLLICTIDYFYNQDAYDKCMTLAFDIYYGCLFSEFD